MLALDSRHLRGGGALLGLDVAEATPEVGVDRVEGGCPRLQRLHDAGVLFIGQGEGAAAVRAGSPVSAAACAWARQASTSWREMEPIRAWIAGSMLSHT